MEVIFKNEAGNCVIRKEDDKKFVMIELKGKLELDEYKSAFENFLKHVIEIGYTKLVYNVKELSSTDPRARAWYMTSHLPKAFKSIDKSTLLKCALVKPSSLFQRLTLEAVVKGSKARGRELEVKFFDNLDDALAWI
ncbi:MAG: STAS/SEC14 domain-containing protein [Bacteroidota bacterium]